MLFVVNNNNILRIVDELGNLVVKYNYDAYGEILSVTGSLSNSILYKGYLYLSELNMYYCKTRFYVVEFKRWLNNDSIEYLDVNNIDSLNLFSYCYNNPVMGMDPTGHFTILGLLIGIGLGALIVGATALYLAENAGQMVARFAIKTALTFPWIYLNKYL